MLRADRPDEGGGSEVLNFLDSLNDPQLFMACQFMAWAAIGGVYWVVQRIHHG